MSEKTKTLLEWGGKIALVAVSILILALYNKLDERYVTKDQYRQDRDELRQDMKEIQQDIKQLLRQTK